MDTEKGLTLPRLRKCQIQSLKLPCAIIDAATNPGQARKKKTLQKLWTKRHRSHFAVQKGCSVKFSAVIISGQYATLSKNSISFSVGQLMMEKFHNFLFAGLLEFSSARDEMGCEVDL